MIGIEHIEPSDLIKKYVRKISAFSSNEEFSYKQKLTPSAYTYLSYNSANIPTSILGERTITPNERLQIAGPKNSEEIYVQYNGKLIQVLGGFKLFGLSSTYQSCMKNLQK